MIHAKNSVLASFTIPWWDHCDYVTFKEIGAVHEKESRDIQQQHPSTVASANLTTSSDFSQPPKFSKSSTPHLSPTIMSLFSDNHKSSPRIIMQQERKRLQSQ